MKTFKLQITEEELVALIVHHTERLRNSTYDGQKPSNDIAQRIVDLTRGLNKDTPEIEGDPRPNSYKEQAAVKSPETFGWGDS